MSALDDSLVSLFEIGISIQQFNKAAERRVGLSLVQWCVLLRLVDMPATSAQLLAAAVGVHPSSLTQTLKRLLRKKLIFVAEDPNDSRKVLISITRVGRDALDATRLRMGECSGELEALSRELERLRDRLRARSRS